MLLNVRSKVAKKILNYFFLNETRKAYVNEIARIIGEEAKNAYRILLRLEEAGILKSEYAGKERYFSANYQEPLYKEYKKIFLKTAGIELSITNKLTNLTGLKEAYIYGSYADNKFGPESDIDLLLVGKHNSIEAEKVLHDLQKSIGREISIVSMTQEELRKRKKNKDQLIIEIFKNKTKRII